jgi:hypothetical protein
VGEVGEGEGGGGIRELRLVVDVLKDVNAVEESLGATNQDARNVVSVISLVYIVCQSDSS